MTQSVKVRSHGLCKDDCPIFEVDASKGRTLPHPSQVEQGRFNLFKACFYGLRPYLASNSSGERA